MKVFFTDIRQGKIDAVRRRLDTSPNLVEATATAPPQKDDGQSPLHVAIKTGNVAIAHLLLDRGADVNFMERSTINKWNTPVLHDAIRAAVMCSRWLKRTSFAAGSSTFALANTQDAADQAYELLARMVHAGASATSTDSLGNSALARAILDARQVLPRFNYAQPDLVDPKPLNNELDADLARIFLLLVTGGHADPSSEVDRHSGEPLAERYAQEPVGRFLVTRSS